MSGYKYKICCRCIMDSSDPNINFSIDGLCTHCQNFDKNIWPNWLNINRYDELNSLAKCIKKNSSSDFDCLVGVSGGLDSSYVVYVLVKLMGLRPCLVHVDAGWNTSQAVSNIQKLVDGLNLDLVTIVPNFDSIRRLQRAFLESGIPDQDLVQDIAFFSAIYNFAVQNNIKHIITGSNFSTECCREPEAWGGYLGGDKVLVNSIWEKFGDDQALEMDITDIFKYKVLYRYIYGVRVHSPLNLIRYIKADAENILNDQFGWESFQHKHHESRFTRFYEGYWLPKRFGFDKRRAHFSSLIMTGQMSREEAVQRIAIPEMSDHFYTQEFEYVANKLNLTLNELNFFFNMQKRTFRDYKNRRNLIMLAAKTMRLLGAEKRYFG